MSGSLHGELLRLRHLGDPCTCKCSIVIIYDADKLYWCQTSHHALHSNACGVAVTTNGTEVVVTKYSLVVSGSAGCGSNLMMFLYPCVSPDDDTVSDSTKHARGFHQTAHWTYSLLYYQHTLLTSCFNGVAATYVEWDSFFNRDCYCNCLTLMSSSATEPVTVIIGFSMFCKSSTVKPRYSELFHSQSELQTPRTILLRLENYTIMNAYEIKSLCIFHYVKEL